MMFYVGYDVILNNHFYGLKNALYESYVSKSYKQDSSLLATSFDKI